MPNLYVASPQPPAVALAPVVGEDMSADFLYTASQGYSLRFDPASDVENTHSAQGALLKLKPTAAPPSLATLFAYDAVSKKLKIAVDGQAIPLEVDLGALDDEGSKLVLNGQNLELQNAAGVVLSSTPITQLDAQQITAAAAGGEYKITLSNGGSVTIKVADITQMFPDGTPTAASKLLTKEGTAVTVSALPVAPSQLTAGALPSTVTVPATNITGVLPANALPPTTNVLAWDTATAKLTSTVNGLASSVTIAGGNIAIAAGNGFSGLGTTTSPLNLKVDPTSPAPVTVGANGISVAIPATTNTLAVSPTDGLVSTVNGVAAKTPLSAIVTCDAVKAAFATVSAPTPTMNLLNDACGKVKLKQDVSATGRLLPTWSVVA